jgi:hypothetical protein
MSDATGKPKDPEAIRQAVLADPNTALIAKALGVPLDEYVEGVVVFAMNPEAKPEYVGVTDEVMKERFGLTPMKEQEIISLFDRNVEIATIATKTDFTASEKKKVDLSANRAAPAAPEDPKLKEELKKQLLGQKSNK